MKKKKKTLYAKQKKVFVNCNVNKAHSLTM